MARVKVRVTTLDLFKDADKSDLRLSADLHRTDYPEGVRQYPLTVRKNDSTGPEETEGAACASIHIRNL